jgi:hypothetical protein
MPTIGNPGSTSQFQPWAGRCVAPKGSQDKDWQGADEIPHSDYKLRAGELLSDMETRKYMENASQKLGIEWYLGHAEQAPLLVNKECGLPDHTNPGAASPIRYLFPTQVNGLPSPNLILAIGCFPSRLPKKSYNPVAFRRARRRWLNLGISRVLKRYVLIWFWGVFGMCGEQPDQPTFIFAIDIEARIKPSHPLRKKSHGG